MKFRLGRDLAIASLGVVLAGCGALAPYSATRDAQGKALQESYDKWKLSSVFETAAKNRENILKSQIEVIADLESIRRDGYIGYVATAQGPQHTVHYQLDALSQMTGADEVIGATIQGETPAARLQSRRDRSIVLSQWYVQQTMIDNERTVLSQFLNKEFSRVGLVMPTCEDIKADGKSKKAIEAWLVKNRATVEGASLAPAYVELTAKCSIIDQALTAQRALKLGGALGAVKTRLFEEQTEYNNLKAHTEAERTQVEAELGERKAAVAAAEAASAAGDGPAKAQAESDIRTAAAKVQGLLAKIKTAQDVFSVEFISDKSHDALDEFLTTVTETKEGEAPKADANKAAMALVLFPDLMKSVQTKLDEADAISLTPLIMQKAVAKIERDAAARDIAVREKRIAILKQQEALLTAQVDRLVQLDFLVAGTPPSMTSFDSKKYPDTPPLSKQLLQLPFAEVLATTDGVLKTKKISTTLNGKRKEEPVSVAYADRVKLWQAAATYIDDGVRVHQAVVELSLKLDALANQTLLSYSEANVTQWSTLIGVKVDQLARYGKTGITAEQYALFVNNLMLFWIGLGVH